MTWIVNGAYLLVAILFILGLKAMSSPKTASRGIKWAGLGMVLATVVTFFLPNADGGLLFFAPGKSLNLILTVVALVIGLCTMTMVTIGIMLGRALGALVGKRAEIIGGVILIIIGCAILYEHLSAASAVVGAA